MSDLTDSKSKSMSLGGDANGDQPRLPGASIALEPQGWFSRFRDWGTDWCSSILVKEARQALKSYSFFVTYVLVISAVVICTVAVIAEGVMGFNRSPNWEQVSETLFIGYALILGFPLAIVVPFSAYRSLAKEYEDGTIQLISITTMKPYQVVIGKLGTAMLQMLIYVSVVAPCIALTYMLDAISYPLIVTVLLIAVGGSTILTIIGLLLAGASRSHALGVAISAFAVLGLGSLFILWCNLVPEMVSGRSFDSQIFENPETRFVLFGFIAFFGSTAITMLAAAAAQISFDSDNRSTSIRVALLFQLFLYLSVIIIAVNINGYFEEIMFGNVIFVSHFWLLFGSMVVSESPGLSQRVQRTLPTSFLGRSCKSLLMPGPGRGYLFSVGCLLGTVAGVLFAQHLDMILFGGRMLGSLVSNGFSTNGSFGVEYEQMLALTPANRSTTYWLSFYACVCLLAYPLFFLSLTFLLVKGFRAINSRSFRGATGPVLGLVTCVLLVAALSIGTFIIWQQNYEYRNRYGYAQNNYAPDTTLNMIYHFNWYRGIESVGNNIFSRGTVYNSFYQMLPFICTSGFFTLLASCLAIRELRYLPTAAPQKVQQEIEQEQAQRNAGEAVPKGESIEDIFGKLPPREGDTETKSE